MNIFLRFWRWLLSLFWTKTLKVVVIGLPAAGKTTLVRAFSGKDTEEETIPTVGTEQTVTKVGNVEFEICDFGGTCKFLWQSVLPASDVILFVVDSTQSEDIAASERELNDIVSNPDLLQKPILVIANKQDLSEAYREDEIIARLRLSDINSDNIKLFCTSAKKKTNIDVLIRWMVDNL